MAKTRDELITRRGEVDVFTPENAEGYRPVGNVGIY
jgi:hypothetical protein